MTNSNKAAMVILGAAAAVAAYRFFTMPEEDRSAFLRHIKETTTDLLDNAEETVVKVDNFIAQIDDRGRDEWIDKLYLVKKFFKDLYGSDKRYLL